MHDLVDDRHLALHALVIKGFASFDALAAASGVAPDVLAGVLERLEAEGAARQRQGRMPGWQPTPDARAAHHLALAGSIAEDDRTALVAMYEEFSGLNGELKELCTRWQLRGPDGAQVVNDHSDATYDAAVIADLAALNGRAAVVLGSCVDRLPRLERYRRRLTDALGAVRAGDIDRLTKPMHDSYHDIWMELHEDLIRALDLARTEADA